MALIPAGGACVSLHILDPLPLGLTLFSRTTADVGTCSFAPVPIKAQGDIGSGVQVLVNTPTTTYSGIIHSSRVFLTVSNRGQHWNEDFRSDMIALLELVPTLGCSSLVLCFQDAPADVELVRALMYVGFQVCVSACVGVTVKVNQGHDVWKGVMLGMEV